MWEISTPVLVQQELLLRWLANAVDSSFDLGAPSTLGYSPLLPLYSLVSSRIKSDVNSSVLSMATVESSYLKRVNSIEREVKDHRERASPIMKESSNLPADATALAQRKQTRRK